MSRTLGLGYGIMDDEYFLRLKARTQELAALSKHSVEAQLLLFKVFALNACIAELLMWLAFQKKPDGGKGELLGYLEKVLEQQLADVELPDEKRAELGKVLRSFQSFNPLQMNSTDMKLWFARQEERLVDAGFSRVESRYPRREFPKRLARCTIEDRGRRLSHRTKMRAHVSMPTDALLPSDTRKLLALLPVLRADLLKRPGVE